MTVFRSAKAIILMPLTLSVLLACQPQAPSSKTSSTQDLLAQVEAIEADESVLLFQQAKAAAEADNVIEAQSLIKKALERGAGSTGKAEAETELKKAQARIAKRKRLAEAESARQRRLNAAIANLEKSINNSSSSNTARTEDDYCLNASFSGDVKYSCLQKPNFVTNEDARNVLLGNCYSLSSSAINVGYGEVCAAKKAGCHKIKDEQLMFACMSCSGSRKWAATAIAGHVFSCQ